MLKVLKLILSDMNWQQKSSSDFKLMLYYMSDIIGKIFSHKKLNYFVSFFLLNLKQFILHG